ncbi:MAG TPA: ChbG/HpnK family deacetylase, partial [Pyrinomonadaceae bacterium]|nr:ChbG/HpnK family deacetylase [Pyrinomonadaceae bacterium]
MKLNPILRSLGYDARDRVVVTHADDIGMCAATVNCLEELFGFGLVTSASAMIPCDSFAEVARFCRAHARVDMGVHLTLTSEFETHRWRPVTDADRATGLTDDYGYFHRTTSDLAE